MGRNAKTMKLKRYKKLNYRKFELLDEYFMTPDQSIEFVEGLQPGSFTSHSFGCLLGAFIGDSLGSYLEFASRPATLAQIEACM